LAKETQELKDDPEGELAELAGIYKKRGLDSMLAKQVATQLMAHNALEAHARDELGITATVTARPVQAAFASATTFAVGAALPLLAAVLASPSNVITATAGSSLFFLSILGAVAAGTGGAVLWKGALRVTFWGALAMGLTTLVGHLFGTSVG
jgi:VIT1/CCC1 family predicted Fe2+/Mn2+ transporter